MGSFQYDRMALILGSIIKKFVTNILDFNILVFL